MWISAPALKSEHGGESPAAGILNCRVWVRLSVAATVDVSDLDVQFLRGGGRRFRTAPRNLAMRVAIVGLPANGGRPGRRRMPVQLSREPTQEENPVIRPALLANPAGQPSLPAYPNPAASCRFLLQMRRCRGYMAEAQA